MIKGRYVCQVEVDFEYDEEILELDYDNMRDRVMSDWMERTFTAKTEEIFAHGCPKITITRQYADITRIAEP